MKNAIFSIIILMMFAIMLIIPKEVIATNKAILGDINSDNKINSIDMLLLVRHISANANNKHPEWILTDKKLKLADTTKDGNVNTGDLLYVLRYIAADSNNDIKTKHPGWGETREIDFDQEEIDKVIEVTEIKLDKSKIEIEKDKEEKITVTIEPDNATNKEITYSSNDEQIATVDKDGKIKGIKAGTTTIVAKSNNGKTAKCEVIVIENEINPEPTPEPTPTPEPQIIQVTGIKLNKTKIELEKGKEEQVTGTIEPANATNKEITYSSNNEQIATIDKNGKIKGIKAGTTIIVAKSNNGKTAECEVIVKETVVQPTPKPSIIGVTGIKLDKTKVEIVEGNKAKITATIEPSNATNKEVTYSSNNTKIATVDKNGNIKGVKAGTTTIMAVSKGNNKKVAVCTVTVKAKVIKATSIKLNKKSISINMNKSKTATLTATVSPKNTTNKKVTWTSSNTNVATVNQKGKITAKKGGSVTITAKTTNGKKATCKVTIKKSIKVTFKANGGSGGGTQTFTYGKSGQKFNTKVSRNGYTFVQWNTKADGSGKGYKKNSSVSNNWINGISKSINLYAIWQMNNFKNPQMYGADPFVYQKDGYYYYVKSTGNSIKVFKTTTLTNLTQSGGTEIYKGGSIWAPEIHYFNGHWYVYAAIQYDSNEGSRRMYVFESNTSDALGSYTNRGQLNTGGKWAIDGTVLNYNNKLYFIWSGWPGYSNGQQNLYIAQMSSPKQVSGERVCISTPNNSWERVGYPYINEGPQILKHNGSVFIVYSASGSWTSSYCLGLLKLNGSNPLNSSSWSKSGPVFKSGNGVYGPGHACFVKSPDGKEDWIVYHGNTNPYVSEGDDWWGDRKVFIQRFGWNSNGTPNFGSPISPSTSIRPPSGTK